MVTHSILRCAGLLARTCRAMQRASLRSGMHTAVAQGPKRCHALSMVSPDESSTGALASVLAQTARQGDCLCLYGDVGAGKSVFSRAFIRSMADDPELPVPSPTYLLLNTYAEHEGPPVHHFDLYRLAGPNDMGRLGMDEAFDSGVCLIEWAERLEAQTPEAHLGVHLALLSKDEEEECRRELALQGKEACSHAEGGDGDAEAEADFEFEDRRWRRIRLEPHGGDWHQRCRDVAQEIASSADRTGLVLLQDTG